MFAGNRQPGWNVVLLAALVSLVSGLAWAGSGDVHVLPVGRAKLKSKLRLQIDTRWVDGTGYRPIVLEAIPTPGPALEDRQIRVILKPHGSTGHDITTWIDIPQGARSGRKVVPVPQDELWHMIAVEVFESGRPIEELSTNYLNVPRTNYFNWTEASPAMLFIDSDVPPRALRDTAVSRFRAAGTDPNPIYKLPDYRNFVRLFPESNYANMLVPADGSQKAGDLDLLSQLNDVPRAELLPPAELPERWLELTSLDIIFISLDDLNELATHHPKRFEAIRDWVSTGPILCVYGVGDKFERLAELEKRLRLSPLPKNDSDDSLRGWSKPHDDKRFQDLPNISYGYPAQNYGPATDPTTAPAPTTTKKKSKPSKETPFVIREAELGYVVAIAAENPFPGERSYWTWMLNTVPNERWMWYRRHGMSMHRDNDDFWNFLIPGVGVAPVMSFVLLITLFAAVIGPVNYIVLGRWRRLYLLLITVPVGAAVVTISLFLYAIATDGLGVRARVRSFTRLDARSGHAVSWSQQSYYASLAPSKGLEFPETAAVVPLLHRPTSRSGQRTSGRKLEWNDGQHLRSGYLSSRSAAQFVIVQAVPTDSKLVVMPQTSGRPPKVKNDLGVGIDYLVVADQKIKDDNSKVPIPSTLWVYEKLKAGETREGKATETKEVQKRLNDIYAANAPAYPKDYDPRVHNSAIQFLLPNYRYAYVDSASEETSMATSVLERELARLARKGDLVLEPGTFLAVAESPREVPLGVERPRQDKSLHVVQGRW